jgi:zinc protease
MRWLLGALMSTLFVSIFFTIQLQAEEVSIRFPVEKYTLPNGLVVLLAEDHSAPIISYQTWFRVGSKNEETGYTGLAHLFEHMMFTGTPRYKRDQFDAILQMNGATNNAFTTNDYTAFYENLPSSKLELVMDIEADRMVNLQVTAENLKSEREVVKEERRYRVDNNPMGVLQEALQDTAYKVHPYKWPVIGYMKDIDHITLEKAQEFYKTYYAPNNAVLVIAGDFKTKNAKSLIEKYYGPLHSSVIPQKARPAEPLQTDARSRFISRDVQNMTYILAYHVPGAGQYETYALDLLASILGGGNSSRLYKRLVYTTQQATNVGAGNYSLQDPSLLQIYVTLKPGQGLNEAEQFTYTEVWRPRIQGVTESELSMAKKRVAKGYIDSLKTVFGKAESLAQNEVLFGNYEEMFKDFSRYEKVTVPEIKAVAEKYLLPKQSTLVVLIPKTKKTKATQE